MEQAYAQLSQLIQFTEQEYGKLSVEWNQKFCHKNKENSKIVQYNKQNKYKLEQAKRQPIQLPIKITKTFKGKSSLEKETIEGILLWIDNENGSRSIVKPNCKANMRALAFVLITKTTQHSSAYAGEIHTSVTGTVKVLQKNSQSGWYGLKDAENNVTLDSYRTSEGGCGFINPPHASFLIRDILAMHSKQPVSNFYHNIDFLSQCFQTIDLNKLIVYLCKDKLHLIVPPSKI